MLWVAKQLWCSCAFFCALVCVFSCAGFWSLWSGLCSRLQNSCGVLVLFLCSSLCFFLCWFLEFVVGFVLQDSKAVVRFLCSLLHSSLQLFGQIAGLIQILSTVDSRFRNWPGLAK